MLKGPWQVAAIDDPRRAYLIYRDANADYWAAMPEGAALLEGRVPDVYKRQIWRSMIVSTVNVFFRKTNIHS